MKKGFTVVEMLGVFILLALIALIAVPTVNKLKDQYEEDTFKESVKGILTAAESFHAENEYENFPDEGLLISDERLNIKNQSQYEDGYITYNHDIGRFEVRLLTNGNFCARGSKDNLKITKGNCETDYSCFTANSGVITDYNYDDEKCTKDVKIPEILAGSEVVAIGENAFSFDDNSVFCSSNGFVTKTEHDINYVPAASEVCISKNAFNDLIDEKAVEYVILPKKVNRIGKNAFSGTNLKMLDLSKLESFTTIEDSAFFGANNFLKIIINKNITSIGNYAFYKTKLYDFDFSKLKNLSTIGKYSFSETNLTKIDLSKSTNLTKIDNNAFYKLNNRNIKLYLGNKTSLNTLGVGSFCETHYEIKSPVNMNSSISDSTLTNACLNY